MDPQRIDALESLKCKAAGCLQRSHDFVESLRRQYRLLRDRSVRPDQWDKLQGNVEQWCQRLLDDVHQLDQLNGAFDLYDFVEAANLDFLKPVRFFEFDFQTATAAAQEIASALVEDCGAITDWPLWPNLTNDDRRQDCRYVLRRWRLTGPVLRTWCLQAQTECRRAIRSESERLEREKAPQAGNGKVDCRAKIAKRRNRVKELRRDHDTGTEWARLAKMANEDAEIKALGLKPLTRDTVRNDCIPPHRRQGQRGKS